MEKFIVSARKYRPNNFLALVGQESIATTLKNSIKRDQLAHAYLFCGPRGVGKTSTARIFAKTINCLNPSEDLEPCGECESCRSFAEGRSYCIHELDAASNNSVDDIRLLTEKVRIPPQIGKYSVYIIDEVHMLSSAAFNAFLKTLEEPPAHAIFILATTEKHKILPTILSRCQTYDFNRISIEDIVKNLSEIAVKEGISIDTDSLHVIAQKADGAMRDALTLFDQTVAFCGTQVEYSAVIKNLNVLDYDYYFNLIECSLGGNFAKALLLFDEVLSKGFNALYFIGGLSRHLRNLLVCKDSSTLKLLEMAPTLVDKYKVQCERCSFKFLYDSLAATVKCEADYRASNNQRLLVEFLLIRLSQFGKPQPQQQVQPQQQSQGQAQQQVAETVRHEAKNEVVAPAVSGGFSIKGIMQKAQAATTVSVVESNAVKEDKSITKEALLEAWKRMGDSQTAYPRLGTAIKQSEPVLEDDNVTIIFNVSNSAQKVWIEKNSILSLTKFLQDELDNRNLKLLVKVKEVVEQEKKLYMPHEKAEFLLKNNPELRELHKELDLDIK
ncbi:MAG: DNA polymerase III subunit gamma/tau [Bacteroidales bacterium]|nr:DNA polymerase III subunit gamma/tau [Bacteroidales bacterium]